MSQTATAYEVGSLYEVAPAELKIGTNVRTDTHPDARQFAASIKERGVLEVITAYPDPEGGLTVVRGQRRALVSARVGTPTGTVPVRVVPSPGEVDRIIDQVAENAHREGVHVRETRDAIEQLALLGVSAAQIAKRAALPRPVVNTALTVVAHQATKERMDVHNMTLDDAVIFAEFEDDPDAVAALTAIWSEPWKRKRIGHYAQQLRDERTERQALNAEIERLRGGGLPVLDPQDVPQDLHRHRLTHLRTEDGEPIPQEQWPSITGAALVVTLEWADPAGDERANEDDDELAEPEQVHVPVWVCTDPGAAGLRNACGYRTQADAGETAGPQSEQDRAAREAQDEARRAAESAERRRVIANNQAWKSAEVVRREWLTGLLSRRTVPAGAEVVIAQALLLREPSLSHALLHGHRLLADLLGVQAAQDASAYYGDRATCARILEQASTPKAATMRTLAAVLAAWEERSGTHTWRNPNTWDAAVMGALIGWGYPASDVEQLLVPTADSATDTSPEG